MKHILLFLVFFSQVAIGQKLNKSEKKIIDNLKSSISYLASDQLEGRNTGSAGEKLAYEYLSAQFEKTGLAPKGSDGSFIQPFDIYEGKEILPATSLILDGNALALNKDYFPFSFSASGHVKADVSPALREKNAPWFWDISDLMTENQGNPHFNVAESIQKKAGEFQKLGATALIVYNSAPDSATLAFEPRLSVETVGIPVVYVNKSSAVKYFTDNASSVSVDLSVALGDKKRTGHNVIGLLDNHAANTVIIGAHYDHLGYGEDHNSLWAGKREIHPGADDNASGTAAVLELAKLLKNAPLKNNNYLFICFSGEELGLFGSKHFTEHPTIDLQKVNYMINCDMVGRLNDSSRSITIGGYGTSPEWGKLLPEKTKALNVKFDSSGIGPSDHTSFYLKNIPVLFFFSGMHSDYHKPGDVASKINYTGELRIIQYIYDVVNKANGEGKLAFARTREPNMSTAHFTVTLGIMPDYTSQQTGLRVDDVIDGKAAQKAGILKGDIITALGSEKVTEINTYMEALSRYKKGDRATVTVMRGKEQKTFDIIF